MTTVTNQDARLKMIRQQARRDAAADPHLPEGAKHRIAQLLSPTPCRTHEGAPR